MVTDPAFSVVTTPSFTVAISPLDVRHTTAGSVTSWGITVAVSVSECPASTVASVWLMVIDVALTTPGVTVTLQLADTPLPSVAVAVITASPGLTPLTTPSATVAASSLSDVHASAFVVALEGMTVGESVNVSPARSDSSALANAMLSTSVAGTVALQLDGPTS